ncbi:hypothetical protein PSN45_000237 [Yamadazyma tenuis]|uniref:WD40 repeat-like protein n=1 Tax=Candida tenuis (strain ATCC 10573 / BCRC 21748 / CBS 615 / JCM 9827 / NBRC 10315 / NRRL Y-1498 / VKM Y-70) TaxID=590646 RepID=G3BBK3_CANTC|nr:WD40 repeat-like protein [Yamadazyma tenuis ATCC 10573]XP_006688733.1 uncharacterized protein CANTEDRAFT_115024 [Yamadazyma tenuis ATCC 10573]EGV62562.1 WD40 repeat-like protein [Yamadazyma tenuis ATCC 10573]EGV62563.1 hypothetical protein CANTEDRAFT_115024 [Yamadazyma tenuis ATCC 10573]WEJ92781.1 hypothetical protein PSN45_000237 [Yamadazyma tenuis]
MSLSSTELNYLVWRYLQESGNELAAYAFDKETSCSEFEKNKATEVFSKIEPGYLVNLVQKGILYSLTEADARDETTRPEILTFFGSLLKEEKFIELSKTLPTTNDADVEMRPAEANGGVKHEISDVFHTQRVSPTIQFDQSSFSKWHPSTNVLAYVKADSSLLISAISGDKIAESAFLKGPGLENVCDLTAVSWSPLGNLIATANLVGDLSLWSPDGRLRNIAKGAIPHEEGTKPEVILDIKWSPNGQYFLTGGSNGKICLWNGSTLKLIQTVTHSSKASSEGWSTCWLDDLRFTVSCKSNTIKVNLIDNSNDFTDANTVIKTIGELRGHEGPASALSFNNASKLLISYSNSDNLIKLWSSNSPASESTVLRDEHKILPVVLLSWFPQELNSDLISVSINGTIRTWSLDKESPTDSVNIFRDDSCYNFDDKEPLKNNGSIVYAAELSPDGKWLALGDDAGRVSIWDVSVSPRCKGIFDQHDFDGSILNAESGNGISFISWNQGSDNLSVSFHGAPSVIINWNA